MSSMRGCGFAFLVSLASAAFSGECHAELRAGAAAIDITPAELPVIINGYFNERQASTVTDRLIARTLVLSDSNLTIAITVVDNLMLPRDLIDEAKEIAAQQTGIPSEQMMVSATHTHSAPSAMGALGSRADPRYREFLPPRIAASIIEANKKLVPAKVGWTVAAAPDHNHCRRWIFRPDRMPNDPFGVQNVRAHMHPGYQSVNHIGPAGPADTDLSLLAVQTASGVPLCVLANFAMHYYGSEPLSADVCGRFGERLGKLLGQSSDSFVGILSQGTSGDSMWMDYSKPQSSPGLDAYTDGLARIAYDALQKIEYRDSVSLAMAESRLRLRRRVPDSERLAWAKDVLASLKERRPESQPEIYAQEQIFLHETPEVELKLQAIRIGELGIVGIPDEVYGLTGLKLKAQSPLSPTFVIELANGAEGYIPPPEQHVLGGYTTWPARTAGLEVEAEPRIVAALLELLERVANKPRRPLIDPTTPYSQAVMQSNPVAYWRLGDMAGTTAVDATGRNRSTYEKGVVFSLPGPDGPGLTDGPRGNRAAQFAGGRVHGKLTLGDSYSVSLWCWNGLPSNARAVTGYFMSRGAAGDSDSLGDHLGIGGTHLPASTGRLILFNGNDRDELLVGKSEFPLREWFHVTMVREGNQATVYLNGEPDLSGALAGPSSSTELFFGGRSDNFANLEGRLDEIAVYDRPLSAAEVQSLLRSAKE